MKKTDEYLRHAKDCRRLAKQMESGDQRDQLIKMAETWEVLARERDRTVRNRGEDHPLQVLPDAQRLISQFIPPRWSGFVTQA